MDLEAISTKDDENYYNNAFTNISNEIIALQSPDILPITGAIYSSNGIINALKSALSNAGTFPSETINDTTAQETTKVTEALTNPTESIVLNKYKDGTYIGQGNGYRGLVQLSVVISNGEIFSITTIISTDDAKYYNMAFSNIINNIILNQSHLVNTVTGATYSSRGIIEAVINALSKAATMEITTTPSETQTSIIIETEDDYEDEEDTKDIEDDEEDD